MKKSVLLGALCLSAVNVANADSLLGVYAGAQGWNYSGSGGVANSSDLLRMNYTSNTRASYYIALEHPIPLLPNIKIRRNILKDDGTATLANDFQFNGKAFASGNVVQNSIDFSNTDYILYYELFDNDTLSFDFGVNIKDVDGYVRVSDAGDGTLTASEKFSGYIPMLYAKAEVGLPLTGWGAFAEGNFLAINSHKVYDYQAAVYYNVLDNMAVDMSVQLGYRAFSIKLNDLDNVYSDLRFNGAFAGIELHF